MTHHWDEFSKSLADRFVPRRESLRLLGAAVAGALLGPLGARNRRRRRGRPGHGPVQPPAQVSQSDR
jgi:hypothetical protein